MVRLKTLGVAVVLFAANSAMAADVTNVNTGADSVNEAHVSIKNETSVKVENDADIDNDVFLKLSTGDNEVEKNTSGEAEENGEAGASIETGDAEARVEILNKVNEAKVEVDQCCQDEEEDEEGEELPPKEEEEGGELPAAEEIALADGQGGGALEGFGGGALPEAGVDSLFLSFGAAGLATVLRRLKEMRK